jgi:hypothetical protein
MGVISTKALTKVVLREPERKQSAHKVLDCFCCGRPFVYKRATGDDSGRFCSSRCREGFDAGSSIRSNAYMNTP